MMVFCIKEVVMKIKEVEIEVNLKDLMIDWIW